MPFNKINTVRMNTETNLVFLSTGRLPSFSFSVTHALLVIEKDYFIKYLVLVV